MLEDLSVLYHIKNEIDLLDKYSSNNIYNTEASEYTKASIPLYLEDDSPLSKLHNELSNNKLNTEHANFAFNAKGRHLGEIGVLERMRGLVANREDIDFDNISLSETYRDHSLDTKTMGGAYNFTLVDAHANKQRWLAMQGAITYGGFIEGENNQVETDLYNKKDEGLSSEIYKLVDDKKVNNTTKYKKEEGFSPEIYKPIEHKKEEGFSPEIYKPIENKKIYNPKPNELYKSVEYKKDKGFVPEIYTTIQNKKDEGLSPEIYKSAEYKKDEGLKKLYNPNNIEEKTFSEIYKSVEYKKDEEIKKIYNNNEIEQNSSTEIYTTNNKNEKILHKTNIIKKEVKSNNKKINKHNSMKNNEIGVEIDTINYTKESNKKLFKSENNIITKTIKSNKDKFIKFLNK